MQEWETKQLMRNHLKNMKASTRRSDGSIEYHSIMTYEDYKASLIEGMSDLGYPLRKEVKRDRFVLNSEGMRQTMEIATRKALEWHEQEIYAFLQNEVKQEIARSASEVLNSISWNGSSFDVKAKPSLFEKHLMSMATKLGKGIADDIVYIFNDMMNGRSGKKKRKK